MMFRHEPSSSRKVFYKSRLTKEKPSWSDINFANDQTLTTNVKNYSPIFEETVL